MKVLALVILVIGSSSGLGSGPYLPSGWKPSGPSFYLPGEVQKPVAIPLKDAPLQETESSGSAFLREYGPPKTQVQQTATANNQVSQDLTRQSLPDPVTEQAFVVIEAKFNPEDETKAAVTEEILTEQVTTVVETASGAENIKEQNTESETLVEETTDVETQTESSLAVEEGTTEKLEKIIEVAEKIAKIEEAVTKTVEDSQKQSIQLETENSNNNIAAVEQNSEVAEVRAVEEGVKNIAEALVNLEKEIKDEQAQSVREVTEVRTIAEENTGSVQNAPQGFLEYGPPGFTEYGPPKENIIAVTEENLISTNDISEARRRRFSPKFITIKKKN